MLIDSYRPASRERQRVGRFLVVGASGTALDFLLLIVAAVSFLSWVTQPLQARLAARHKPTPPAATVRSSGAACLQIHPV